MKFVTEIFIGEKEKWTNKGNDKRRRLILSYTIQQVIPNICTKFQNLKFSSSWEIFDEKKKMFTHNTTHPQTLLLKRQKLYTTYILRILGYDHGMYATVVVFTHKMYIHACTEILLQQGVDHEILWSI